MISVLRRVDVRTVGSRFAAVIAVAMTVVSCATVATPPGTASARFFHNPDRVWLAIGETLETLGYEVEASNRVDGVIRAVPRAGGESARFALEISQVMHTTDQVNVYAKPVPAADAPPDREMMDAAARDFVTVLERKLGV